MISSMRISHTRLMCSWWPTAVLLHTCSQCGALQHPAWLTGNCVVVVVVAVAAAVAASWSRVPASLCPCPCCDEMLLETVTVG